MGGVAIGVSQADDIPWQARLSAAETQFTGYPVREERKMYSIGSRKSGYFLAAILGAVGGGAAIAVATDAVPKMLSQVMSGMMRNMMVELGAGACDPAEM